MRCRTERQGGGVSASGFMGPVTSRSPQSHRRLSPTFQQSLLAIRCLFLSPPSPPGFFTEPVHQNDRKHDGDSSACDTFDPKQNDQKNLVLTVSTTCQRVVLPIHQRITPGRTGDVAR